MAQFKTILTNIGLAKISNAIALGQTIHLTEMAVGDGNGNPVEPTQDQTALVREVYRGQLNRLEPDPQNQAYVIAELIIPANVGGWTVHEVGVFDDDGDMLAVANFPATYKPVAVEGSTRDLVVRVYIEVTNASVVELQIDPSVVLASRAWVVDNFLSAKGGVTHQLLRKKSNADNDVEWFSPDSDTVNVSTETVEEEQVLAAGQRVVNWAVVNTSGLAVYVDGIRLAAGREFIVNSPTQITLEQDYPAGASVLGVQNDPDSQVTPVAIGALAADENLADVPDKDAARGNLEVFSRAEVEAMLRPQWIRPRQLGEEVSVLATSNFAFTALSSTDVAVLDSATSQLYTYRFDGSAWSQVGEGSFISGTTDRTLVAVSGTEVIITSSFDARLYRLEDGEWGFVSNPAIPASARGVTAMSATDLACVHSVGDHRRLFMMTRSGDDWVEVGDYLVIPGQGSYRLAALNGTDVACIDTDSGSLRTYRFDGSAWSQMGDQLVIGPLSWPYITALNGTDVAVVDSNGTSIHVYRFNGAAWAEVGAWEILPGMSSPIIAALNGTDVALLNGGHGSGDGALRTYRFDFYLGEGPHSPVNPGW